MRVIASEEAQRDDLLELCELLQRDDRVVRAPVTLTRQRTQLRVYARRKLTANAQSSEQVPRASRASCTSSRARASRRSCRATMAR